MADLHPGLSALRPLLGTWSGRGAGDYPTIEHFDYLEDVVIGHIGKPFLTYTQRTRSPAGQPMHAETGYLRMPADGCVELVLAHPTGVTEIDEGTLTVTGETLLIEIASTAIGLSSSAKPVVSLHRSIKVEGDQLHYVVQMGAVGQPLQHHLSATLHRQP